MGKEQKETEVYVIGDKRGSARIDYSGVFDMVGLLGSIKNFFIKRRYAFLQKEHSEAVKTSGRDFKFEINPFRNVNDYMRFYFLVTIEGRRCVEVLVEEDNRKVKVR